MKECKGKILYSAKEGVGLIGRTCSPTHTGGNNDPCPPRTVPFSFPPPLLPHSLFLFSLSPNLFLFFSSPISLPVQFVFVLFGNMHSGLSPRQRPSPSQGPSPNEGPSPGQGPTQSETRPQSGLQPVNHPENHPGTLFQP